MFRCDVTYGKGSPAHSFTGRDQLFFFPELFFRWSTVSVRASNFVPTLLKPPATNTAMTPAALRVTARLPAAAAFGPCLPQPFPAIVFFSCFPRCRSAICGLFQYHASDGRRLTQPRTFCVFCAAVARAAIVCCSSGSHRIRTVLSSGDCVEEQTCEKLEEVPHHCEHTLNARGVRRQQL